MFECIPHLKLRELLDSDQKLMNFFEPRKVAILDIWALWLETKVANGAQ